MIADLVEDAGGGLLDLGEVVAMFAHHAAQLGVGLAGLLGRGDLLGLAALEFFVEREDVLQRFGGDAFADLQR